MTEEGLSVYQHMLFISFSVTPLEAYSRISAFCIFCFLQMQYWEWMKVETIISKTTNLLNMEGLFMWVGYVKDKYAPQDFKLKFLSADQITCILLRLNSCSIHRDFISFSIIPGLTLHMSIPICSTQYFLSLSDILYPSTYAQCTLRCVLVLQSKATVGRVSCKCTVI